MYSLPGERPFMRVGTACGNQEIPRPNSNIWLTHKGSSDEAIVVIKRFTVDRTGDSSEDKINRKQQEVEAKGGT
jgi:hypothetical protein